MVNFAHRPRSFQKESLPQNGSQRFSALASIAAVGIGINLFVYSYTAISNYQTGLRLSLAGSPEIAEASPAGIALNDPLTETHIWDLFEGGSNSIVGRAVGTAEGTRTADGGKTQSWYGHKDPGDAAWNIGTFSYNRTRDRTGITAPETADQHYLQILKARTRLMLKQAKKTGVTLTLAEWINTIDLLTQSPEAALGWSDQQNPGFISNLIRIKQRGINGQQAIIAARIDGFRNNATQKYEAWTDKQGLTRDQQRRTLAVTKTVEAWLKQQHRTVSFTPPLPFNSIESQNPYGTTEWKSCTQQIQSRYWQMGAWDAINQQPMMSQDPDYLKGYQFTQSHAF